VGATRGIWLFRVVFYGAAIAFLTVHFWPHGGESRAAVSEPTLSGSTSQGQAIKLRVGGKRVTALDMRFRTRCSNGAIWFSRWWPADGAPVPFKNRGPAFDVREPNAWTASDGARAHMYAWLTGETSADRRTATGAAHLVAVFNGGRYARPVRCDSGPVAYTASRTS
jgi:hypothetical protein